MCPLQHILVAHCRSLCIQHTGGAQQLLADLLNQQELPLGCLGLPLVHSRLGVTSRRAKTFWLLSGIVGHALIFPGQAQEGGSLALLAGAEGIVGSVRNLGQGHPV